jgi:cold shock CspA family protein
MAAAGLDPNAVLQALIQFDNATLSAIIAQLLQSKPELAPGIVNVAIPDLTYAPTKALTERRCSGIVKKLNSQFGIGLIECPELSQVFGCDVIVEKNQVQHVTEGQHVNFAVTLNSENKPQAFDLVDYALAMASAPKVVQGFGGWGAGAGGMEAWGKGGGAGGAGDMSAMMMQMQMMGADPMAAQQIACGGGDKGKGKGKGNQVILGEFLGVIKSYNLEKGFGFIACDALKDQVEAITAATANTASTIVLRDASGNFSAGTITAALSGNATTASTAGSTTTVTTGGSVTTTNITTGAAATAGTITGNWSLTAGSRMQATYADLAEYYEGDREYAVGTVLVFGGDKEVTESTTHRTTRVAGVVSDQSAYIMNSGCPGIKTCVALQGRVPVNVIGAVAKGDMLVASSIPGYAVVDNDPKVGTVIGKAVGVKTDSDRGTVEAVVGRV